MILCIILYETDEQPTANLVIISHTLWQRHDQLHKENVDEEKTKHDDHCKK